MFKIAQTPLARSWHIRPMSMGEWYQHKALQCARLAQDASDPLGRRRYEEEEKAWRQLAHQIEAHETVQSDPTSGLSERSTVVRTSVSRARPRWIKLLSTAEKRNIASTWQNQRSAKSSEQSGLAWPNPGYE
jgi:hypothetical protein